MVTVAPTVTNPNRKAFLDAIAYAEGVTHGYNTLFGNNTFTSFADHPRQRFPFKTRSGVAGVTTAAGRYQFTATTWDGLVAQYRYPDFGPASQDSAALALVLRRNALDDVDAGRFSTAVTKCRNEWASLPGNNYDQGGGKTMAEVLAAIASSLGGVSFNPSSSTPPRLPVNADIVTIAQNQIGVREKPGNVNRYAPLVGHQNGQPWCATFAVWCAQEAHIAIPSRSALTDEQYFAAKRAGLFQEPTVKASRGWFILYDFAHNGTPASHIGIVINDDGRNITTIEGNTGITGGGADGVFQRTRGRKNVVGFIAIPTGSSTTDLTAIGAANLSGTTGVSAGGGNTDPGIDLLTDAVLSTGRFMTLITGLNDVLLETATATISMSTRLVTELIVTVHDPGFVLLTSGAFVKGETYMSWAGWPLVLAAIEAEGGPHGTGQLKLTARSIIAQQLKDLKGPDLLSNISPSEAVQRKAVFALTQPTLRRSQLGPAEPQPGKKAETWYDVIAKLAVEEGFLFFEVAGKVFFGQPSYLVAAINESITIRWPDSQLDGLIGCPRVRTTTDDTERDTVVSFLVHARLGVRFRPGQLIALEGMGPFDGAYLVSDVSGAMDTTQPWSVTGILPKDPDKQAPTATAAPTGGNAGVDTTGDTGAL